LKKWRNNAKQMELENTMNKWKATKKQKKKATKKQKKAKKWALGKLSRKAAFGTWAGGLCQPPTLS